MLGLAARSQPGVVVLTEPLVAGSRRWTGARRPAGTAGVWLGGRGGHRGHVWALKAEQEQPGDRRGAMCSESSGCSRRLDRSCDLPAPWRGSTPMFPLIPETEGAYRGLSIVI